MTDVGPFARMASDVQTQGGALVEALSTVLARVGLLAAVHPLVHDHVVAFRETLIAVGAGVGFHAGVHAVVDAQLLRARESLAADVAEVLLLEHLLLADDDVLSHVLFETVVTCESLRADAALIRADHSVDGHLVIADLVRGEVTGERKFLVADDAAERFDALVHVVVLLIQDAIVETLTAQRAGVDVLPQVIRVDVNHDGRPPGSVVLTEGAPETLALIVIEQMSRILVGLHEGLATKFADEFLFVLQNVRFDPFLGLTLRVTRKTNERLLFVIVLVVVLSVIVVFPM